MYAIYRELNPPTGVEHCIECNFFDEKQKSLVVAATSVLRVYDLRCKVRLWCASFRVTTLAPNPHNFLPLFSLIG